MHGVKVFKKDGFCDSVRHCVCFVTPLFPLFFVISSEWLEVPASITIPLVVFFCLITVLRHKVNWFGFLR